MALAADLEPQFDGFERFYRCHEVDRNKKDFTPGEPVAAGEFKGLKRVPEFHRKHDGAWLKEGEAAERGKGKGKEKGGPSRTRFCNCSSMAARGANVDRPGVSGWFSWAAAPPRLRP